jgi:hypothetical protein
MRSKVCPRATPTSSSSSCLEAGMARNRGANWRQSFPSETNRTSSAAAPRMISSFCPGRRPWRPCPGLIYCCPFRAPEGRTTASSRREPAVQLDHNSEVSGGWFPPLTQSVKCHESRCRCAARGSSMPGTGCVPRGPDL